MKVLPSQDLEKYLLSEGIVSDSDSDSISMIVDPADARRLPFIEFAMAVAATAVVCALAVVLGWQIALIVVAGLVAKKLSDRPAHRSTF